MRHAQELETQNDKGFPSPDSSQPAIDTLALQRDADQLAALAASVPPGVKNVNRGLLAKDMLQKLKQIEKLSKHLRSELGR
jgi:hypothetical protein